MRALILAAYTTLAIGGPVGSADDAITIAKKVCQKQWPQVFENFAYWRAAQYDNVWRVEATWLLERYFSETLEFDINRVTGALSDCERGIGTGHPRDLMLIPGPHLELDNTPPSIAYAK